jgi:hypothetical protein
VHASMMIIGVVATGGGFLLVMAGAGRLRRPATMRAALIAQRLFPVRWHRYLVTATIAAELTVGIWVVATMVLAPEAARPALVAETAVFCAFAGYLAVVRRSRRGAPCGCFGDEVTTWLTVGRPAVFAVGAGCAGWLAPVHAAPVPWRLVSLAGGFVSAMVAWLVPLMVPSQRGASGASGGYARPDASRRTGG